MHLRVLQVFAIWLSLTNALYTPKGSFCGVACGTKARNFTGTSDLVCLDTAYNDDTKGVLFKGCIECLGNSTYFNESASYLGNSDQYWYLCMSFPVCLFSLADTVQGTSNMFSNIASSILLKPPQPITAQETAVLCKTRLTLPGSTTKQVYNLSMDSAAGILLYT